MRVVRLVGLALLIVAGPVLAGEYAVLRSGARLHIDRHEFDGSHVLLFNGTGSCEMDRSAVVDYEADEAPPPKPAPAAEPPRQRPTILELADAAADRYGLPRQLVRSVVAAESGFQQNAVSPKGAIGLMQLMPSTAQALGADPRDAAQNLDAGTRYLRDLLERYEFGLYHALAAYNAGPGAVDKYRGVPPYPETINYISRIVRDLKKQQ